PWLHRWRDRGRIVGQVRLAGAALVPVDHGEVLLQPARGPPGDATGGEAGAAMDDQQHRVGPVLAADAHELPDAADGQVLVTLDAGRRDDPAQLADDADGVLARRGLLLLCGSREDSDQYGDGNSKKPEGPHTPGPRGGREGSRVPL